MIITTKTIRTELNQILRNRIQNICKKLVNINNSKNTDATKVEFEISRISKHHRKGNVFKSEINFALGGKSFLAESSAETPLTALDNSFDILKEEIISWKEKRQSKTKRSGVKKQKLNGEGNKMKDFTDYSLEE